MSLPAPRHRTVNPAVPGAGPGAGEAAVAGNGTGWEGAGCFAAGEGGLRWALLRGFIPPCTGHTGWGDAGPCWGTGWGASNPCSRGSGGREVGVLGAQPAPLDAGLGGWWVSRAVPFAGHLGEVTSDIFCLPVSPLLGPHPWVPTASAWLSLHPITPCPSWHCTPQPYPQMRLCPITLSPPALHPMTPCPLRHCTLQPCASGLCTPQQPALHPVPGLPCRSLQAQPGHRCRADPCPHPASSHQDPGGSPRPRAPRKQLPGEVGLYWAWPGFAWA